MFYTKFLQVCFFSLVVLIGSSFKAYSSDVAIDMGYAGQNKEGCPVSLKTVWIGGTLCVVAVCAVASYFVPEDDYYHRELLGITGGALVGVGIVGNFIWDSMVTMGRGTYWVYQKVKKE